MKFPKSVTILGCKVRIKYVDEVIQYDGRSLWGLYDPNDRTIAIFCGQSESGIWETLYHEMGHALFDLAGVNQSATSMDVQEILVEQYSRFIHANFVMRKKKGR